MRWLVLGLLIGCTTTTPVGPDTGVQTTPFVPPCGESGEGMLEVALAGEAYGSLQSGDEMWCGNPPQGGAPYTPLVLRMRHLNEVRDGTNLKMVAVDVNTDEVLGETELLMGFTCANVGENTDWWVSGGEAHLRYSGYTLEELEGREVELQLTVSNTVGDNIISTYEVTLTL